jgi:hypothetical protein
LLKSCIKASCGHCFHWTFEKLPLCTIEHDRKQICLERKISIPLYYFERYFAAMSECCEKWNLQNMTKITKVREVKVQWCKGSILTLIASCDFHFQGQKSLYIYNFVTVHANDKWREVLKWAWETQHHESSAALLYWNALPGWLVFSYAFCTSSQKMDCWFWHSSLKSLHCWPECSLY